MKKKHTVPFLLALVLAAACCLPPQAAEQPKNDAIEWVDWMEPFEDNTVLTDWTATGATLTLEEEALRMDLAAGNAAIVTEAYDMIAVGVERTGLTFRLKAQGADRLRALDLTLTDGDGLSARYTLAVSRLREAEYVSFSVPINGAVEQDEGFSYNAVKLTLAAAADGPCTLWLDDIVFALYRDAYWYNWLFDYAVAPGDYALAVLPDLQNTNVRFPQKMNQMMQWIADHRLREHIRMALCMGDVTWNGHQGYENAGAVTEFQRSDEAFGILDGAEVNYAICYGNHDYTPGKPRSTAMYNDTFPLSRFQKMPVFGGAMDEEKSDNTYYFFTANGIRYLVLSLEFAPETATVAWANQIIGDHPECNVILMTHSYLAGSRLTAEGGGLWNKLVKKHANIFLVLCGHEFHPDVPGDIGQRVDVGPEGNTVYSFMVNSQDIDTELGQTPLLMLRFTNGGNTVDGNYFSVHTGAAFRPENQFTFTLPEGQLITPRRSAEILLERLPEPLTAADAPAVAEAVMALYALPEEERAAVADAGKAAAALQALQPLLTPADWAALTDEYLRRLDVVDPDPAALQAVRTAVEALSDEARSQLTRLDRLIAAEAARARAAVTPGDVNGDAAVNAADALQALQHSVKLVELTGKAATAADVNGDGQINAADALLILQYSVRLIDTFPVEG